ncbi:MFS transporter [Pendulispora albinea]|uniref:MHS family MFS transporter n=1 Tax=Pendulispora albinea TaxID=2741071 RepID=A0ABZ2M1B9_9BACT
MKVEPAAVRSKSAFAKVVGAGVAGTTIEFYDFFVYGSAAAIVFNKVFFPNTEPLVGALLALSTYAMGFLARPLGGVVFGHFGDRLGRRRTLMVSLVIMGGATVAIGLIPSYATIGVAAPILLTVLRLVQGLALGGEWGGAVFLIAEHGDERRRGFWSSWPQTGGPLGNLLATGVLSSMSSFVTDEAFLRWGWRIPFLASALLVLFGLWLRHAVEESPIFVELQSEARASVAAQAAAEPAPLRTVLARHKRAVLISAMAAVGEKATYYTFSIFLLTYLVEVLHLPKQIGLTAVLIASGFQAAGVLVGGWASDVLGRRRINVLLAILIAGWAFVGLPFVDRGTFGSVLLAVLVGLSLHGLLAGSQSAFFAELFPSTVRYTGASLGYQLASVIGGSAVPLLGVALLRDYHSTTPIALLLAGTLTSTGLAFVLSGETQTRDLRSIDS